MGLWTLWVRAGRCQSRSPKVGKVEKSPTAPFPITASRRAEPLGSRWPSVCEGMCYPHWPPVCGHLHSPCRTSQIHLEKIHPFLSQGNDLILQIYKPRQNKNETWKTKQNQWSKSRGCCSQHHGQSSCVQLGQNLGLDPDAFSSSCPWSQLTLVSVPRDWSGVHCELQNLRLKPGPAAEAPWLVVVRWKPVSFRSSSPWGASGTMGPWPGQPHPGEPPPPPSPSSPPLTSWL